MAENDHKLEKGIKDSLDFLDRSVEVKKPDFMKFVELVNNVEEKREVEKERPSGNVQFLLFILTAALVVCLETFVYNRSLLLFVILQAAAVVCILPVVLLRLRRGLRQVPR